MYKGMNVGIWCPLCLHKLIMYHGIMVYIKSKAVELTETTRIEQYCQI